MGKERTHDQPRASEPTPDCIHFYVLLFVDLNSNASFALCDNTLFFLSLTFYKSFFFMTFSNPLQHTHTAQHRFSWCPFYHLNLSLVADFTIQK